MRLLLVGENAYWSLLAASLAGWTAWPFVHESPTQLGLTVLAVVFVALVGGLSVLLFRNIRAIRWIDRQVEARQPMPA